MQIRLGVGGCAIVHASLVEAVFRSFVSASWEKVWAHGGSVLIFSRVLFLAIIF